MKWKRGGKGRIEDRRGAGGGLGGGGIPIPMGKAGGGIGGIILLVAIYFLTGGLPGGGGGGFGVDPGTGGFGPAPAGGSALENAPEDDDEQEAFVRFVVGDVEDTWRKVFADSGQTYEQTTLVIFERGVSTGGCGNAPSAVGPFYCPADRQV